MVVFVLYGTDFERMWVPEGEMPRSRPWVIVSTPKVMGSIFWSPVGFPVITALPPRPKVSSASFYDNIIPKIVEGIPFDLAESPRKLMLHTDNTSRRRARIVPLFEEIPNTANLPSTRLLGSGSLLLLPVWEAERSVRQARIAQSLLNSQAEAIPVYALFKCVYQSRELSSISIKR
jgi:hypothetical protein